MSKVINVEQMSSWVLDKKHSEQTYVIEEYDDGTPGFHAIKINSMEHLTCLIEHLLQDGLHNKLIFRGQRNSDWKLQSSLEREIKSVKTQEQYNEIAQKHISNFKKLARGKIREQSLLLGNSEENNEELWAIGQHLGLKTPLIDWTRSFLIALFFAFHKEKTETKYRCVYRLLENLLKIDDKHKYIVNPKMDHYGRLTSQKGLFTYWGIDFHIRSLLIVIDNVTSSSLSKDTKQRKLITKYYISNELRKDILNYLEKYGITEDSIYPDLSGIINKANSHLKGIIHDSN